MYDGLKSFLVGITYNSKGKDQPGNVANPAREVS